MLLKIQSHYPVERDEKDYYVFQCKDVIKKEYYLYYWELIDYTNNIWKFKSKFDHINQKNPSLECVSKEMQTFMKRKLQEQAKRLTEVFETNQKHGLIEDINFIKQQKEGLVVGEIKFYVKEESNLIYFQKRGTKWEVRYDFSNYYVRFIARSRGNSSEGLEKEILSHPKIRLHLALH